MLDVAIIGAGAGGLSIAKLLHERGLQATVFEAGAEVGGKSHSINDYRSPVEMGTCYTTLSHGTAKRWMRETGIGLKRNGIAKYDGRDFRQYVEEGAGKPFLLQMAAYLRHAWSLRSRLAKTPDDPEVLAEAALTIQDWLRERDLPKMELFLHRIQTVMGYGFLDETTAVQAQSWCTGSLIASGFLNQLHMPVEGWSEFWRRLALPLDVRVNTPVRRIERAPDHVRIVTDGGAFTARHLISSIPVDAFAALTELTADEQRVRDAVIWGGYTTALVAVENWHTTFQVNGYSETVKPGAPLGQMVGARLEATDPDLGALYVTGQLSGDYSDEELREILESDIVKRGGENPQVIRLRSWRYFARLTQKAVRDGILQHMDEMQGRARTWHTGSTFSFEAVSHIVAHNERLAPLVEAALQRDFEQASA